MPKSKDISEIHGTEFFQLSNDETESSEQYLSLSNNNTNNTITNKKRFAEKPLKDTVKNQDEEAFGARIVKKSKI